MHKHKLGIGLATVLALAALALAAQGTQSYAVTVLMWIAVNALTAAALRFVMLVGELNIATAAFYGIGAYASAICTVWFDLPLPLALLAGAVAGTVVSLMFGFITMRTKGPYFLLISFAFTEVIRLIYTRLDSIGGNSGMVGIFPPVALDAWFPLVLVSIVIVGLLGLYLIERSTLGTIFRAIQNNDAIVRSVGINVLSIKLACLGIASFAAGLAGSLHAHMNNVISPGDFSFLVAVFALAYVKIGGEANILGVIIGAACLTTLSHFLLTFGNLEHIFFGSALIIAMLAMPDGLLGLFTSWYDRSQRLGDQDAVTSTATEQSP